METLFVIIAIVVGIVEQVLTFKLFFYGFDDYVECWRYSWQPDIISVFRGEYLEDCKSQFKLSLYHSLGIIGGIACYFGLAKLFL